MERGLLFIAFLFLSVTGFSQQKVTFGFPVDEDQTPVKVFPNPTTDYFQLSQIPNAKRIAVRNVAYSVKTFTYSPNAQYEVAGLPEGDYSVFVWDDKGSLIKVLRLRVGGFRP